MPKRTTSFRSWQLEKLTSPKRAASYLNASIAESPEQFLIALGKVSQANQMSTVAKGAGVQRETLYRALSDRGNPTFDTLTKVLSMVGLRISVVEVDQSPKSSSSIIRNYTTAIPTNQSLWSYEAVGEAVGPLRINLPHVQQHPRPWMPNIGDTNGHAN